MWKMNQGISGKNKLNFFSVKTYQNNLMLKRKMLAIKPGKHVIANLRDTKQHYYSLINWFRFLRFIDFIPKESQWKLQNFLPFLYYPLRCQHAHLSSTLSHFLQGKSLQNLHKYTKQKTRTVNQETSFFYQVALQEKKP